MMDKGMKKRWISLYVENQVGVLSKISGLFSGKSYNLDSLTVGTTEDPTVSRMTIATVSDDETFEQIKKQLNRMIEVIKVIDFTDVFVRMKEILYIKVKGCSPEDKVELFQIAETFKARVIDYGKDSLLLEFVQTATKNDAVIKLIKEEFKHIEVVRGGSVGIESISMMERLINRDFYSPEFVHIHSLFLHKFKHCLFRRNRRDSASLLHTQSSNCISQNSTLFDFFPFHFFNILIHRKDTA